MPTAPRLVVLEGLANVDGQRMQAYPIEKYPYTIGRARDCNLIVDHSQVSRLHACLSYDHEQVVLTDLSSTNGTFINGEQLVPHQPYRLRAGDRIKIAQVCTFEFDDPGTTIQMKAIQPPPVALVIDESSAHVSIDGTRIDPPLSPSQFSLLVLLMQNEGRLVSRDDLRMQVWGPEEEVTDQTIDALVSRLRKRLEEIDPHHEYILTRRGFGLSFRNRPSKEPAENYL